MGNRVGKYEWYKMKYKKRRNFQCSYCVEHWEDVNNKDRCSYHAVVMSESAYLKGTSGTSCKYFKKVKGSASQD